jgi:hypothetical protein
MISESTYDETAMAMTLDQNRQAEEDKRLLVMFSVRPWHDKLASAQEGRPIYKDRDYVTIMVPGDKDSVVERPATDIDKRRFAAQYAAFKAQKSQETVVGTPLKVVTFLSASQAKELEYFNIFTVEQLAGMPDGNAARVMGAQKLKQLATDFLRAAQEQAPLTAMREEMEKKDAEIATLQEAVRELTETVKELKKQK